MRTFEELKKLLLDKAKKANACQKGYKMGLESRDKSDLLEAITENWLWVVRETKIVDATFLEENFTEEELNEAGIYTQKVHEIKTVAFVCGNATVKAYNNATVKAYDSATVEAYDSATVKAYNSATVKAYDSATVEACDSATVKAYDSATVEAYDSATVKAYNNATVKACGNSYVEDCHGGIMPCSDFAIVKDYYNHKIYIKKGNFEVIEID